jgi:hypothetical protein
MKCITKWMEKVPSIEISTQGELFEYKYQVMTYEFDKSLILDKNIKDY